MEKILELNEEMVSMEERVPYQIRDAVRIVLVVDNKVALIHYAKYQYYGLPGGGIDVGENISDSAIREMIEETGLHVIVKGEIGYIDEIRREEELINHTYGVYAELEKHGIQKLEDNEVEAGIELVWVPLSEYENLILNITTGVLYHKYCAERDVCFIKTFLNKISQ